MVIAKRRTRTESEITSSTWRTRRTIQSKHTQAQRTRGQVSNRKHKGTRGTGGAQGGTGGKHKGRGKHGRLVGMGVDQPLHLRRVSCRWGKDRPICNHHSVTPLGSKYIPWQQVLAPGELPSFPQLGSRCSSSRCRPWLQAVANLQHKEGCQ